MTGVSRAERPPALLPIKMPISESQILRPVVVGHVVFTGAIVVTDHFADGCVERRRHRSTQTSFVE